jgi:hypothetical protein
MIISWSNRGIKYFDASFVRILYGRLTAVVNNRRSVRIVPSILADSIAKSSCLDIETLASAGPVVAGAEVE